MDNTKQLVTLAKTVLCIMGLIAMITLIMGYCDHPGHRQKIKTLTYDISSDDNDEFDHMLYELMINNKDKSVTININVIQSIDWNEHTYQDI